MSDLGAILFCVHFCVDGLFKVVNDKKRIEYFQMCCMKIFVNFKW